MMNDMNSDDMNSDDMNDVWFIVFDHMAPCHVFADAENASITVQDYIYESVRLSIKAGARINQGSAYAELCRQIGVACC